MLSVCIHIPFDLVCNQGLRFIKLFTCSTQLTIKFFLVTSTFMSRKNSKLGLSEHEKCLIARPADGRSDQFWFSAL